MKQKNFALAAGALALSMFASTASAAIIVTEAEAGGTAVHSDPGQVASIVTGTVGVGGELVTLSTTGPAPNTITTFGGGAATYSGPFDDFLISFLTPKSIVGFNLELFNSRGPVDTGFSIFVNGGLITSFASPIGAPQKYTVTATGADVINTINLTFAPDVIGAVKQIRVTGLPGGGGGTGVVPEPATWLMMIAGFGGVGAMMRRRRVAVA